MDFSDAVLSGSAVLAALYRESWGANDLDFYCNLPALYTMIYHLALIEDYHLLNPEVLENQRITPRLRALQRVQRPYDDHSHIARVAYLRKGDLEINVILSSCRSPLNPIAAFWATHVQNFLTCGFICISYPLLLEKCFTLVTPAQLVDMQLPAGKALALIRKYEGRGFSFAVRPPALQAGFCGGQAAPACSSSVRFFGDRHSLVLHTRPLATRANKHDGRGILHDKTIFRWCGGFVCGGKCGLVGMRFWPGILPKPPTDVEVAPLV
ncbi:hypothetical protein V8D89_008771 [Ganoderma adspersum]